MEGHIVFCHELTEGDLRRVLPPLSPLRGVARCDGDVAEGGEGRGGEGRGGEERGEKREGGGEGRGGEERGERREERGGRGGERREERGEGRGGEGRGGEGRGGEGREEEGGRKGERSGEEELAQIDWGGQKSELSGTLNTYVQIYNYVVMYSYASRT